MRRFPCFKRINRAHRFDGFLWNLAKMFPGYQCAKVCEAFLIFQILLLLRAPMWRISTNIQFANFKIDFLSNQSEYRKSLTHFCSVSPTDWHCAVCLVVRASRKAGNSVKQIVSVLRLKACLRLSLNQILNMFIFLIIHFISFTMIYTFLWLKQKRRAYEWFFGRHSWRSTVTLKKCSRKL